MHFKHKHTNISLYLNLGIHQSNDHAGKLMFIYVKHTHEGGLQPRTSYIDYLT